MTIKEAGMYFVALVIFAAIFAGLIAVGDLIKSGLSCL
jgi:hypothetical protein